jgi:hypothetical protein
MCVWLTDVAFLIDGMYVLQVVGVYLTNLVMVSQVAYG